MDSVIGLRLLESAQKVQQQMVAEAAKEAKANDHSDDPEAAEIDALVKERTEAKKAKDFARADAIRDQLTQRGITIIDTPSGPTWKRV